MQMDEDKSSDDAQAKLPPAAAANPFSVILDKNLLNYIRPNVANPEINLRRIRRIETYEVMESDITDLDNAAQSESQSLAFASLCFGALLSAGMSWISIGTPTAVQTGVFVPSMIVFVIGTAFFTTTWLRQSKGRKALIDRIRSKTVTIESEESIG